MTKSFILSVLLLFFIGTSFAQVHEIPLNRNKSKQNLVQKSKSGVRYTFSHDFIYGKSKSSKDGSTYTNIWLKGSYPNGFVGEPNIPAYKKLIVIPKGSNPIVTIISNSEQLINLKEKGIDKPIYPNQPSVSKNQDTSKVEFTINKSSYFKKSFTNNPIATIEVLGNLRSATVARLVVNPIDYNPGDGLLKVYNDIEVEVNYSEKSQSVEEQILDPKTYSPYFETVYKTLGQSNSSYTEHPDLTKYPVKMLIISNRMFEQTLQPFIQWKKMKGFNVKTVYTDEIGTSADQIKTYIQQEYNSATQESPAPTFLVIVGDVDNMPASTSGSATGRSTDLYYASVDGDMFPEMYYGRLSASNTTQLESIISKILYYEKYQFSDPTYLNKVTLIAGADGEWNPKVGQPAIKYGTANYFKQSNGFTAINEFGVSNDPNNPSASSDYTGCYNTDRISVGFINYTAHGSETSWVGPYLSSSSISSFSNSDKYPIVIGNCCQTANFGTSECFGETWIRAQGKGAVTYIGSSPDSYWLEDFYWAVGAFPMVGSNESGYVPTFQETTTGAYDAPFVSKYVTTGGILFTGNLAVTEVDNQGFSSSSGSSPLYYWQAYNILGDPSIMPYFTEGEVNQVSYSPTVVVGQNVVNVSALEGSYVAISKNNELLGTKFYNITGEEGVSVLNLNEVGDVIITITRPQTKPIIDTIQAINPTGPYLFLDSYSINDLSSNNNSKADYNESFNTNIKIKNVGVENATNVKVKIIGGDSYMSIIGNDSISVSDIPFTSGSNTIDISNAFSLRTLEKVPDQHISSFTLKLYSDQGLWTSKLQIPINSPILSIGTLKVDDNLPGCDNDGLLNPGESCKIIVPLINQGHSMAKSVTITIDIPDSLKNDISVSNINNTSFNIEANTTTDIPFNISVNANFRKEIAIPIKLQLNVVEPSGLNELIEKVFEVTQKGIDMKSGTVTTCFTYFYDSGGKYDKYKNYEDYTLTFKPCVDGQKIKVSFLNFDLEQVSDCRYDKLTIYDGLTTSSTMIGAYCGTNSPQVVQATNSDGALTFVFHSDEGVVLSGWKAIVESVNPTITPTITTKIIRVYPNPVSGIINIDSEKPIKRITLLNTLGTIVSSKAVGYSKQESLSLEGKASGAYILIIYTENSIPEKTLIIKK